MGLFSKIFGGGTKVTQTATQETTVNTQVDVTNDIQIKTEEMAQILAEFGDKTAEFGKKTTELIQAISQQNAIELITQLNFADLIRRRTKQIGIIAGTLVLWWFLKGKRKKKR